MYHDIYFGLIVDEMHVYDKFMDEIKSSGFVHWPNSSIVSFGIPSFRVLSLQNQTRIYPSKAEIQTENVFLINSNIFLKQILRKNSILLTKADYFLFANSYCAVLSHKHFFSGLRLKLKPGLLFDWNMNS